MNIYKREFIYLDDMEDEISIIVEDELIKIVFEDDFIDNNFNHNKEEQELLDLYEEFTPFKNDDILKLHRLKESIDSILDELKEKYREITEDDIDDERVIALSKHLDITLKEALEEINEASANYYEYGNQEYRVLTDSEADDAEYESVKSTIEDCYLDDIKDSPAYHYVDVDKWVEDLMGNRGENLASYDNEENEEEVNNITYYIYRIN